MNNNKNKSEARKIKENSFGWMINILASNVRVLLKEELAKVDLKVNHFKILMTLLNEQGLNQTQIGRKVIMPGYAITRNIDQLEELKLLERRASKESRRSHLIFLTKKGKGLAPTLFAIIEKVNTKFLSPIDDQDKGKLFEILRKLM